MSAMKNENNKDFNSAHSVHLYDDNYYNTRGSTVLFYILVDQL